MAVTFVTPRVRRDVRWLAAGILAIALGGLCSWFVFSSVSQTHQVVKLARTVYRGQLITAADLAVVSINKNADVPVVASEHFNEVVGQSAQADLVSGSLLTKGSFGAPTLVKGSTRVGVKLEAGRLPISPIRSGASVLVVSVPSGQAGQTVQVGASVDAVVAQAPEKSPDGGWLLDLNVPSSNAEQVARWAALKQMAIVVTGEG